MRIPRFTKTALLMLSCVILFVACKAPDSTSIAAGPAVDSADAADFTAAADPNAINGPIAPEAFKAGLSLAGEPTLADDRASITYPMKVDNKGTAPVYGERQNSISLSAFPA